VDAILYVNRTGCSWRQLPHDFPPWDTVYWYFKTWNSDGVTDRIHDALRAAVRNADGRDPMASAGIVDAQSVKGADTVGSATRGYDAGKKVTGRKRHIVTDTLGLLVVVLVTAASIQDRDGGRRVLAQVEMAMPSIALCGPTAATPASSSPGWHGAAESCSRSCAIPRDNAPSRYSHAAGWSNARCPGSSGAVAWTVTTNACPNTPKP
jgi:transposase